VWNLHYTAPESLRYDYPIAAVPHDTPRYPLGPRALPGVYTVKLTAGGRTYSQTLTVKEDPRVHVTPLALAAQFAMERQLASGMNRSYDALQQVKKFREDLKQRGGDDALDKQAASLEGGAGGPGAFFGRGGGGDSFMRMNLEFGVLYAQVDGSDAAPTVAQEAAARALEAKLASMLAKWKQLQAKSSPK
ncbi:MAG TPA: hypothetical protein VMV59_05870, partial [Candidatus Dormibacteraeota bacterium]|nr:hypothetical protein [Candidatus Dormibacteraeota bacterium]